MCSWLPHYVQTSSLTMHMTHPLYPVLQTWMFPQLWEAPVLVLLPLQNSYTLNLCSSCLWVLYLFMYNTDFYSAQKLQHPFNQCHKLTVYLFNNFIPPSCSVSGLPSMIFLSSPFYYSIWITFFVTMKEQTEYKVGNYICLVRQCYRRTIILYALLHFISNNSQSDWLVWLA